MESKYFHSKRNIRCETYLGLKIESLAQLNSIFMHFDNIRYKLNIISLFNIIVQIIFILKFLEHLKESQPNQRFLGAQNSKLNLSNLT